MMSFLYSLWGKTVTTVVAGVSLVAMLLGLRYKIQKGARDAMSADIQRRTLERVERKQKIEADAAGLSDDDVLDRLRDKGLIRD